MPEPLEIPDAIARLGPDVAPALERMVADAERRQARELEEALASALRIVPRPLRGLARKVLLS